MNWNDPAKITIAKYGVDNAAIDQVREHYAQTLTAVSVDALDPSGLVTVSDVHFSCGEFDIWSGQCPTGMRVTLKDPPSSWCLYVPIAGAMEISNDRLSSVYSEGLLLTDLSSTSTLTLLPGRSHIGVSLPKAAVERELSMLIGEPVNREVSLKPETLSADYLSQAVTQHVTHIWSVLVKSGQDEICPNGVNSLFRALAVVLLECGEHNHSETIRRSRQTALPRQVRRAIEFMTDNIGAPLDIVSIAKEANVSPRALQLAFQQFNQTTPMSFLRELRLNAVHNDLLGPDSGEPVATIALKRGFKHMGRFAAQYKRAFGELPTETLKRKVRATAVDEHDSRLRGDS